MSASDDGIFSDAYWNMHRNSLFFSIVALIFSLPGVTLSSAVPTIGIGSIDEVSSRFMVFVLLGVALYSVSIFTLEWRQQALPYLRKQSRYFSDRRQSDQENFSALRSAVSNLLPLLETLRELVPQDVEALDEDFGDRPRLTSELSHQSNQYTMLINRVIAEKSEDTANEAFASIRSAIDAETRLQIEYARDQQSRRRIVSVIRDSLTVLDRSSELLRYIDLIGIRRWIRLRTFHYNFDFSADVFRIFIIGLALPWIIFATSLLHFLGKSFFQIAPAINRLFG